MLARLFAPFVLVDGGWEQALDVALANPGVIAVTREGDRFGGPTPWRAGPPGSSAVTYPRRSTDHGRQMTRDGS